MLKNFFTEIYMEKHQIKYRYERKYLVPKSDEFSFIREILSNNFLEIFSTRKINNIYFEDNYFNSYTDNYEGFSDREKIRLRWYGETFKSSEKTLEFKIKKEAVNYKKTFHIGKFKLNNPVETNNLKELYSNKRKKEFMNKLINKEPIVFNSYTRTYYLNEKIKTRITIDNDIKYKSFISGRTFNEKNLVIEIKYDSENNFFNKFSSYLQLSKYSKYMTGIKFDIEKL